MELHSNTGETLNDGVTGVARERRSKANLDRLLEKDIGEGKAVTMFLPKYRPGMDVADYDKRSEAVWLEGLTKVLGPPKRK